MTTKKPQVPPLTDDEPGVTEEPVIIHPPPVIEQPQPVVMIDKTGRTTIVWKHPG